MTELERRLATLKNSIDFWSRYAETAMRRAKELCEVEKFDAAESEEAAAGNALDFLDELRDECCRIEEEMQKLDTVKALEKIKEQTDAVIAQVMAL